MEKNKILKTVIAPVVLVGLLVVGYFFIKNKTTIEVIDSGSGDFRLAEQKSSKPIINSINILSGSVDSEIVIHGSGFENDEDVGSEFNYPVVNFGEVILDFWSHEFTVFDDKTIKFVIPSEGCTMTTSEVGGCFEENQIKINPGVYPISVYIPKKQGTESNSNEINFTVVPAISSFREHQSEDNQSSINAEPIELIKKLIYEHDRFQEYSGNPYTEYSIEAVDDVPLDNRGDFIASVFNILKNALVIGSFEGNISNTYLPVRLMSLDNLLIASYCFNDGNSLPPGLNPNTRIFS